MTVEEEKQLKDSLAASLPLGVIASALGKTENAVRQKMIRLKLKEEEKLQTKISSSTNASASGNESLPSVEQALKTLNKALKQLETEGLEQAETLRLRSIIQGVKIYIERFADFLNYRELEQRLIELEGKYVALVKKTTKS